MTLDFINAFATVSRTTASVDALKLALTHAQNLLPRGEDHSRKLLTMLTFHLNVAFAAKASARDAYSRACKDMADGGAVAFVGE